MARRTAIALDLGRRRLRALHAQRDGGILRVRSVILAEIPADIEIDDAERYGQWVSRTLKDAGFPRGRATIALAREHVVLKRLTLPTIDEHELPEMTRLAMHRELPFNADTAVIDFVPVRQTEKSTTVLAVAVPQNILDHALRIAKAAKFGVERVSLRSMGSSLLLTHLGDTAERTVLAVDITGDSVEFCVVESGVVRFSRAAELYGDLPHGDSLADAVVTETRRTWMSYRISEGTTDIEHAVVMGDRSVCEDVAGPLTDMLHVDAEVLKHHPLVESGGEEMDRVWPLAGLLLESGHGAKTIDFARPRRAPDLAAARRKRAMFAAGAVVLILLALWTIGHRQLDDLERRAEAMDRTARELFPEYVRFDRDGVKLRHLESWQEATVDWLEHLGHLHAMAPSPDALVLDSWVGTQQFRGVQFDRRTRAWSAPMQVTIDVSGEARDRPTADAFREALVREKVYSTSSTGPDAEGGRRLPFGFTYRLRTDAGRPQEDASDDDPGGDELARQASASRAGEGGTP